jgi:hypothetical protein
LEKDQPPVLGMIERGGAVVTACLQTFNRRANRPAAPLDDGARRHRLYR